MSDMSRRGLFAAFVGAVVAGAAILAPDAAEAQGRGWGPDGLGPPGQRGRGRANGRRRLPPGQVRRALRGRPLPPGQIRRLLRI